MQPIHSKGILLLSFDDRNFAGWEAALPIFARTDAHATFFVSGPIDGEAVSAMRELAAAGHSVGLHGLNHQNADEVIAATSPEEYYQTEVLPQLESAQDAGLRVTSFAYPNCRRTPESDQLFFSHGFAFVRGGLGLTPYDPEGRLADAWKPLADNPRTAFPVSDLPQRRLLNTLIVGEAYNTHIDDLLNCLRRTAERDEVLAVTSHDIAPDAKSINMKTAWLEAILATAAELGVAVLGFNELPMPRSPI
ncbi:MAG: polysaccharide deacetylase family protein [Victivallales bacterium]|nr:polysaccharide deacetylase family protein [Victivallales bacterium]